MKLYVVAAVCLIAYFAFLEQTHALYCSHESECNLGDCCLEYLPFISRCSDRGDDVGDVCGGQFHCDCQRGLYCRLHTPSVWNFLKLGKGRCAKESSDTRYINPEVVIINKEK